MLEGKIFKMACYETCSDVWFGDGDTDTKRQETEPEVVELKTLRSSVRLTRMGSGLEMKRDRSG